MATKIEQNTTDLQAILDAVNNLPDASGGGANVETCTVILSANAENYWATCYENGQFYVVDMSSAIMPALDAPGEETPTTYTINNVVRYSALIVQRMSMYGPTATGSGFTQVAGAETTNPVLFITAENGSTAYITVTNN